MIPFGGGGGGGWKARSTASVASGRKRSDETAVRPHQERLGGVVEALAKESVSRLDLSLF